MLWFVGCSAMGISETFKIGKSVEGRPITVTRVGTGNERVVCVIGGIHGDEQTTCTLVSAIKDTFTKDPGLVPGHASLYFIPVLNPDGIARGTRKNANNVDLNRNFPTENWKKDAVSPSSVTKGSGGISPGSEPETAALTNWLLGKIKKEAREVWILSYHSLYPPSGAVQGGYIEYGKPGKESAGLADFISKETGYKYLDTWVTKNDLTGELLGWCEPLGIAVADIELPDREPPDKVRPGASQSSIDIHKALVSKLLTLLIK